MKKLKFKDLEEKKGRQKKKKEYGRTRTVLYFFLLTKLHGLYPNVKK